MKHTIEIWVSPIGDIKIDAIGFKGADCEKATEFLKAALGTVTATVKKPEYYQAKTAQCQQRVGKPFSMG